MVSGDILIVEDERIIAHDLKKDLENFGYSVCGIASSGRDAITLAEDAHPDLVLMDINIKGNIDGVQVAKVMKNRFNLPVIFLTGYADEATLERVKEVGPAGYLVKPFKQREIRAAIEIALERRTGGAAGKVRENWFSHLVEEAPIGILVMNDQEMITYMNSECARLFKLDASAIIGKAFWSLATMSSGVTTFRGAFQDEMTTFEEICLKSQTDARLACRVRAVKDAEDGETSIVFAVWAGS